MLKYFGLSKAASSEPWESIAVVKRQSLQDAIPSEWVVPAEILPPEEQTDVTTFPRESGWFTDRELEIISTPAPELLTKLSTGAWTSEEVTKTFCKAAAAAHQLVNLTSDYFSSAKSISVVIY